MYWGGGGAEGGGKEGKHKREVDLFALLLTSDSHIDQYHTSPVSSSL